MSANIIARPQSKVNPPWRAASIGFDLSEDTVIISQRDHTRVYSGATVRRHDSIFLQRLSWNRAKWRILRSKTFVIWTTKTPAEIQADERKAEQRRYARQLANSFSRHGWAGHWERR